MSDSGQASMLGGPSLRDDPGSRKSKDVSARLSRMPVGLKLGIDIGDDERKAEIKPIEFFPQNLAGEQAEAVVEARLPDETFLLTYVMEDKARHEMTRLQKRYDEAVLQEEGTGPVAALPVISGRGGKTRKPKFQDAVSNILKLRAAIELASTLRDLAQRTKGAAKQQDLLQEMLSDRFADNFAALRFRVRNERAGIDMVRDLLRSGNETLVEIGIGLAREETLLPTLRDDLARVYEDDRLTPETRDLALSLLPSRIRGRLLAREAEPAGES
jgi:hypothetical protein